jgi:hypothetical protein
LSRSRVELASRRIRRALGRLIYWAWGRVFMAVLGDEKWSEEADHSGYFESVKGGLEERGQEGRVAGCEG